MALRVQMLAAPPALRCACCGEGVERFLPIPPAYVAECRQRDVEHPLDQWETLSLDAYLCPHCGATDRDRLQVSFLSEKVTQRHVGPQSHKDPIRVLEIAPSRPVSNWLKRHAGVAYRSADLEMASADDQVDVTNMACYPGGAFDIVICSHVLEHVPDDLKAMRELRRILAPIGVALLLVPISRVVEDVEEDPSCEDQDERWRRFGQGDHIRIYGRKGFIRRLQRAGFIVETWSPCGTHGAGSSSEGVLYVCRGLSSQL